MSNAASNWAWDVEVPLREKMVLLFLAHKANEAGTAFPGKKAIATACGISLSSVHRATALLRELGFLEVSEQFTSDNRQTTNFYMLRLDRFVPVFCPAADLHEEGGVTRGMGEGVTGDSPGESPVTLPPYPIDTLGGVTADSPMNLHKEHSPPYSPPKSVPTPELDHDRRRQAARVSVRQAMSRGQLGWQDLNPQRPQFEHLRRQYKIFGFIAFCGDRKRGLARWGCLSDAQKRVAIRNFSRYARACKERYFEWRKIPSSERGRKPSPATAADYCGQKFFEDETLLAYE